MSVRNSINTDFYGRPVTARQLLLDDSISPPAAAQPLFTALTELLAGPPASPAEAPGSLARYIIVGPGKLDTSAAIKLSALLLLQLLGITHPLLSGSWKRLSCSSRYPQMRLPRF